MAICKSQSGKLGNGMMRMIGMREISVGIMGMQGIKEGMRGIRVGKMGMLGTRVGMMGMQEIRVGMRGIGARNEGNQDENLCIGVEMMN